MDKQQLKALLAVNLRLLNPQVTDRLRRKGFTGTVLSKKLTHQFYLNTILFLGIYGLSISFLNLNKLPGTFTFYIALFILLGVSQSISGIYNIFFASNDLANYLPLPLRNQEIFFSKLLVVVFNIIPFTTPLLLIFLFTAIRAHVFILVALLMTILMYALMLGIILSLCTLIVFSLTKLKLFQAHQKVVMNLLLGINMILILGGLFLMNRGSTDAGAGVDHAALTPLLPIFKIFTTPTAQVSLFTWIGLLVALGILLALTWRFVLAHLIDHLTQINTTLVTQKTRVNQHPHHHKTLKKGLFSYQLQLLKEPNLMLQLVSNSILMPLIFVITFLFSGSTFNLSQLSLNWLGVCFVGGLALASVMINQTSLVGNFISLDKLNFEFIKALPIPLTQYLRQKFYFGYWFQIVINLIITLIVAIVIRLPLLLDLALILGVGWGTYLFSQHYFIRDYHLRITNWTNVTQLFNRGAGNFGMMLSMMACAILSAVIIFIYGILIASFASMALLINLVALAIITAISGGLLWHYQSAFWRQFD